MNVTCKRTLKKPFFLATLAYKTLDEIFNAKLKIIDVSLKKEYVH